MNRNEKASGLPFNWIPEVFGTGQQGLHGVTLCLVSTSAGRGRASLATGDLCGIECVRQVGAISAQNEKTWAFTG